MSPAVATPAGGGKEEKKAEPTPAPPAEKKKRIRRVGKTEPRKAAKVEEGAGPIASSGKDPVQARVVSKHDEKWNGMFDKLLEYKVRVMCLPVCLFVLFVRPRAPEFVEG